MTTKWGSLAELQETLWYYSQPGRRLRQYGMICPKLCSCKPDLVPLWTQRKLWTLYLRNSGWKIWCCWMMLNVCWRSVPSNHAFSHVVQASAGNYQFDLIWIDLGLLDFASLCHHLLYYLSDTPQCIRHSVRCGARTPRFLIWDLEA